MNFKINAYQLTLASTSRGCEVIKGGCSSRLSLQKSDLRGSLSPAVSELLASGSLSPRCFAFALLCFYESLWLTRFLRVSQTSCTSFSFRVGCLPLGPSQPRFAVGRSPVRRQGPAPVLRFNRCPARLTARNAQGLQM